MKTPRPVNIGEDKDDTINALIRTKSGKLKRLSEITDPSEYQPSAGLGCGNQVIINAINKNKRDKDYLQKLKKQGVKV